MLKLVYGMLVLTFATQLIAAEQLNQQQEHGKYLVHHVAMCIYCHTPKDADGNLERQELLTGAPFPISSPYPNQTWGFQAPNLRSLPARWGEEEFIRFLQTGNTPTGSRPRPPMPPFRMTAEDAAAIGAYLNALK